MDQCTGKLRRIHRLISLLMRRQTRIAFQWEMESGVINFRIRNGAFARKGYAAIGLLFNFSLEGSAGLTFTNLCTAAGQDDVVQLNISLPKEGARPQDWYFAYICGEAMYWLNRLPKRSPAALEEIPKLDFQAIWSSLFNPRREDQMGGDAT